MPIYKNINGVRKKAKIAIMNNQLIPRIYYGNKLVYQSDGSVFESSTAGTYTLVIPATAYYNIIIVGAGGGCASWGGYYSNGYTWNASGGGGSGAYVHGTQRITAGTYTVIVGAGGAGVRNAGIGAGTTTAYDGGNSSFGGHVAGGGKGGVAINGSTGGAGGTATTTLTGESGNAGGSMGYVVGANAYPIQNISGGASKYGGYGAGGYITNQSLDNYNGKDGYVKISFVSFN